MSNDPEVISWLQSPEGEKWSHNRIELATLVDFRPTVYQSMAGYKSEIYVPGLFSIKEDIANGKGVWYSYAAKRKGRPPNYA